MKIEVHGTPANPADSTNTKKIILLNFLRQTGINSAQLSDGFDNQALQLFAKADARIAIAEKNIDDMHKELQQGEASGAQLLIQTKNDETANATIFTQLNHLKQLAAPLANCKKALSDLKTEKPTGFKNALDSISHAPNNKEEMTRIEIKRHEAALLAIQKQYETAANLSSQVKATCHILREYESSYKMAAGVSKRGSEPTVTPKQQPGIG